MVVNNWYATVPGFGVMSDGFDLQGDERGVLVMAHSSIPYSCREMMTRTHAFQFSSRFNTYSSLGFTALVVQGVSSSQ